MNTRENDISNEIEELINMNEEDITRTSFNASIEDVFGDIDANGDGHIYPNDVIAYLTTLGKIGMLDECIVDNIEMATKEDCLVA